MDEIRPQDFLKPDLGEEKLIKEIETAPDGAKKEILAEELKEKQMANRGLFLDEDGKQHMSPLDFVAYFLMRVIVFCVGKCSYFAYNRIKHIYETIDERTIRKLAHLICDEYSENVYTIYVGDKVIRAIFESVTAYQKLPQSKGIIVFRNGTLNLNLASAKAMQFQQKFSSKNIVYQALPYNYEPTADCPKFKKFIREIMKNDMELIHLLLDCLANIFVFGKVYIHHVCYFYGVGRNGKSVLLECLSNYIFPDMCSHLAIDKLGERFGVSALVDKVMNVSPEAEAKLLNTEMVKMVSGGDTITAEYKHKDSFPIKITAKLFVSTNKLPYTDDFSKGWSDRLTLIPFEEVFQIPPADASERKEGVLYQNPHLLEELSAETEGIAILLLKQLDRLKKRKWVLSTAKKAEAVKRRALLEANPVLLFFNSCIDTFPPEKKESIKTSSMHRHFKMWAERNEIEIGRFMGATAFHKAFQTVLKAEGHSVTEPRKIKGIYFYKNIGVKVDYLNFVNYN